MTAKSTPTKPDSLPSFDYQPRTRIVFGLNSVERVGELARGLGAKVVLVVTDPGIVTAGHADRVEHILQSCGLGVLVFDAVHENPTTRDVEKCLAVAKSAGIDTIVGLGGGSSMDTAKGCNFLLTNGGRVQDYWGVGKATRQMLPFIAIPTTAGTGSECQSAALIVDDCYNVAKANGIDTFVALGGGSSMDTAKGCNFLLTNGGRMQDYWGVGKATKPMLPKMPRSSYSC